MNRIKVSVIALLLVGLVSFEGQGQGTRLQDGPRKVVSATDVSLTFVVSGGRYYRITKDQGGIPVFTNVSLVFISLDNIPVPDPNPEPIPDPEPTPKPDLNNPFAGKAGLRAIIIEETRDRGRITPGQLAALQSTALLTYMRDHAAREGNNLEYRILDDDLTEEEQTAAGMNTMWKAAYAKAKLDAKTLTPWVIVSDGTKWESKQLPDETGLMEMLKKYGGP